MVSYVVMVLSGLSICSTNHKLLIVIFDQHQNKMSASNLLISSLYKPHSVVSFIESAERAAPVCSFDILRLKILE